MSIAIRILGWIAFLASIPVVIELSLFLLAHLFLRFRLRKRVDPEPSVKIDYVAVLVPAHNEEKNIERCVASLLASDAGPYRREIFVIADNCSDRTAELARKAGARVIERFDEKVRGKGAALHHAIGKLKDEANQAFIIVDADSVVEPAFVRAMGSHFAAGKEAVQCVYLPLNVEASPKIRLMNLALLSMNVLRPAGREMLGCSVGILGNGFGLTRKLLEKVPYTANSITEDLEYHLKLIENGHRVRFVTDTRVLADFPVSKEGTETQRERWEGGRFLLQRKFFPGMLAKVLSGRVRMLEPLLELMSLPLSYEVLLLFLLIVLPGQPFARYGILGILVIFFQIIAAILFYGEKSDFRALTEVPSYLLWKILRLPRIFSTSKKDAKWIRTKRD